MELTHRQQSILSFIEKFIRKNKYPPTSREISTEFGFAQTAAVNHLNALEKKGAIKRVPNMARTITIV